MLNDGYLYLSSADKKFFKLDSTTLDVKWSYLNDKTASHAPSPAFNLTPRTCVAQTAHLARAPRQFTTPTVINRSWTDDGVFGDSSVYVGASDVLYRFDQGAPPLVSRTAPSNQVPQTVRVSHARSGDGMSGRVAWSYTTSGPVRTARLRPSPPSL